MNKISRYIVRAAVAPFLFGTFTVIFLFLMQFLMKNLDKLVGKGLENIVIVQLITYNIAWMAILAVPMGVLFATLMAFGNMSANHEITILKASGGSLIRMMTPMMIAAIILTYFLFLYNSRVIPETNHSAKTLLYDVQRKKPTFAIEPGQFSNDIDGYTILARQVDTTDNFMYATTIYDFTSPMLNRTINAEKCKINFSKDMTKLEFHLYNGEIHQSNRDKVKNYRLINFNEYVISTKARGFDFERSEDGTISRGDREMFINDMQNIVDDCNNKIHKSKKHITNLLKNNLNFMLGNIQIDNILSIQNTKNVASNEVMHTRNNQPQYSSEVGKSINQLSFNINNSLSIINNLNEQASAYEVEIHKKYAIPFACIVFVLIGCPLGVITKGGNFGLSAAITLFFYVIYWACLITGEKLADRALINPAFSMWLGNIIIGVIGIILTLKANNETLAFNLKKMKNFRKKTQLSK